MLPEFRKKGEDRYASAIKNVYGRGRIALDELRHIVKCLFLFQCKETVSTNRYLLLDVFFFPDYLSTPPESLLRTLLVQGVVMD